MRALKFYPKSGLDLACGELGKKMPDVILNLDEALINLCDVPDNDRIQFARDSGKRQRLGGNEYVFSHKPGRLSNKDIEALGDYDWYTAIMSDET